MAGCFHVSVFCRTFEFCYCFSCWSILSCNISMSSHVANHISIYSFVFQELLKLRKKITSTVQVLTHLKEKLQFVQAENQIQKRKLQSVEELATKVRSNSTSLCHGISTSYYSLTPIFFLSSARQLRPTIT